MFFSMTKLDKKYWIAIICKLCIVITSFLITIVVNRGLGVSGKGEYAYVIKMVEMLYVFFSVGLGQAYATFKRSFGNQMRTSFLTLAIIHSFFVIVLGVFTTSIYYFDFCIPIITLTSIAVTNSIYSMMAVIEDSIQRNIILTIINIGYLIILCVLYFTQQLTLTMALTCFGLNEMVAILFFTFLYKFRLSLQEVIITYQNNTIAQMYRTGFITMVVLLLISINYSVDTIMLKQMSNSYHTGIYSVGVALSNMFLLIPDAFKEVLFGDSTQKYFTKNTAYSSIKVSLTALGFILFGFLLLGEPFIKFFYGPEYLPSYNVTLILFLGCISMVFFKILQPVYIAFGQQTKAAFFLMCSAILNVVINIFLIPVYFSIGAAVASAISYTFCGMLFFIDYMRSKNI